MSASSNASGLTDEQREVLREYADTLIPGGAGLPSASEVDVHMKWIDRVLRARPDLSPHVLAVLKSDGEPRAELDRWRLEKRETFDGFTLAVAGGYFMNPRVRKLLGFPGAAPKRKPPYPDEADYYLDDGQLLEPVLERGPIYRTTSGVAK
jgi:hypothetical protein